MSEDVVGQCPRCVGTGVIGEAGAVACPLCKGMGMIGDSGPAPPPESRGLLAFKPCGCAKDWSGDGADADVRARRISLWQEQGFTWRDAPWSEAAPLLTLGDACRCDPRTTPRAAVGSPDLSDLPPGSEAAP